MKQIRIVLIIIALGLTLTSIAAGHSFDLNLQRVVTLEDILDDLKQVQTVFIGETHDQKAHHDAQLQVIKALHEAGYEISIGLEMFRQDGQPDLDRWVQGEIDEIDFIKIFHDHWSNWPMYTDIFSYARDNQIPMLGLNIPRKFVSQVAREGFDSLTSEQRKNLPMASCNVSQQYRDFMRRILQGHPLTGTAFEHFCEAQILWDASMAANLDEQLQKDPQQTIVVLAGTGHSWKHGIAEQLARFGSYSTRVLLPEIPGRLDLTNTTDDDADYLLQGVEQAPLH